MPARNTLDYTDRDGTRRVRLHNTDILTFPPAGGFTVNTGGWNTVTTRARINAFLPDGYRVYTSRGVIHLRTPKGDFQFRETVTVGPRGVIMRFYLQQVPLDSGGYDRGGAYWGIGERLFWYAPADLVAAGEAEPVAPAVSCLYGAPMGRPSHSGNMEGYLRARDRNAAKAAVRADVCPEAEFFR